MREKTMTYRCFFCIAPRIEFDDFEIPFLPGASPKEEDILPELFADLFHASARQTPEGFVLSVRSGPDDSGWIETLEGYAASLADVHFLASCRSPSRSTFPCLRVEEIQIQGGRLTARTWPIKELVPDARFLRLEALGVQQMFPLWEAILFARKDLWQAYPWVRPYLRSDLLFSLDIFFRERQRNDFHHSLIQYGNAFDASDDLQKLVVLGLSEEDLAPLTSKVAAFQSRDRAVLLAAIADRFSSKSPELSSGERHVASGTSSLQSRVREVEEALGCSLPPFFRQIYDTFGDGGFGPPPGFLSFDAILAATQAIRDAFPLPQTFTLLPFFFRGQGTFSSLDLSSAACPVVAVDLAHAAAASPWYDGIKQDCRSFEEWLDAWLTGGFSEIYDPL